MRLLTYRGERGPSVAAKIEDRFVDLNQADPTLPRSLKALLALGSDGMKRAERAAEAGDPIAGTSITFLPPIVRPSKIICVGLNYADHARETGAQIPDEPLIFNKFPTALLAHEADIQLPSSTRMVDYEAELVVVIGSPGRYISRQTAMQHVAGYCCGHDVSARDWQKDKPGGQWLLGKSFDTFAPVGPHLVTADEIENPGELDIQLRLNGVVMQQSNTRELIFSIDYLIAYISQVCTLESGDLIFTGTPPGVGAARDPQVFLKAGDVVEVEIQRIGVLSNPVAQTLPPPPVSAP